LLILNCSEIGAKKVADWFNNDACLAFCRLKIDVKSLFFTKFNEAVVKISARSEKLLAFVVKGLKRHH
jgi:hypothetical protein